jgi:uncharacterized membrane protein SpoIIM required for sporulation
LTEEQFIKLNSSTWQQLDAIFSKVNTNGVKNMPSNDIKLFLQLFRQSSHDLAYARTYYPKSNIVIYLNALVGKSHSKIYSVKKNSLSNFFSYISFGYPSMLRTIKKYILASFAIFLFGFFLSLMLVLINTDNAKFFLEQNLIDGIISNHSNNSSSWNYPLMSSQIMTNNISVCLRSFAFGITLGIGTIYVLFVNGSLLGALTALIYLYGNPMNFWSLILPHGVIELTAIFISGAAGLIIAKSLLLPNEYSRKDSLIKASKQAVYLVLGIIIMLIIAGIIEGFFTPLNIGEWPKLIFAALTFIALSAYFSIPYIKEMSHK